MGDKTRTFTNKEVGYAMKRLLMLPGKALLIFSAILGVVQIFQLLLIAFGLFPCNHPTVGFLLEVKLAQVNCPFDGVLFLLVN